MDGKAPALNDNCAEWPRPKLWQLFHKAWTQSDGPSYQKAVWLELEKEVLGKVLISKDLFDEMLAACKAAKRRFDMLGLDWIGKDGDPLEAVIAKAQKIAEAK